MRILHLTLSAARGGRRDAILTLVDQLRPLGVECGIVALRDSASDVDEVADRADFVDGMGLSTRPTLHELRKVWQICRDGRFDLIHAHDHGSQYVASALRVFAPSLRAVFTFHRTLGIDTEGGRNRIRNALSMPFINRVLTASEERRRYFLDKTLTRPKKVEVIPHGIDLSRFRPRAGSRNAISAQLGVPDTATLALAIGHFGPEKGIDQVLDAAANADTRLGGNRWHLLVLGSGTPSLTDQLRRQADRLLPGKVTFLGFVPDVVPWLQAADLLIHAPRQEAFGQVVIQAMACGVPVVAVAIGGVPELVEHGASGLLAGQGDVGALGSAIARLISDPAERSRMGERALGCALQRYDAREYARKHFRLYRALVPNARTSGK
jgi:glycosyltransferase involved in cell wall biosynthesis